MPEERGHRWFAAWYDRMNARAEKGVLGRARHDLLADLSGDVLEIGAGTGANFQHYPDAAKVIALEPDPHMLKRARAKLDEVGRTNIEVHAGPAELLPFPDASFDAVVSTLVLCTVSDPAKALAEIRRALRPGGRLVFIEHVRGQGFAGRLQDLIRPIWSWGGAGCQLNRRTADTIRAAGFELSLSEGKKPIPLLPAIVGTATVSATQ
jgi:ubiquinone/menaquinone biosynthesis C-methylase UbiE